MSESRHSEKEYIKQLKLRFASANSEDGLCDDELLTLLLSYTNVGKEAEQLSKKLYSHFGSFRSCFFASYPDLMRVEGMTHNAAMLILLTAKCSHLRKRPNLIGSVVTDYSELFLSLIPPMSKEQLWGAAFDDNDRLIKVEKLLVGTENGVSAPLNAIAGLATMSRSHKIIIAHTHPGLFKAEPSLQDNIVLSNLGRSLNTVGIKLIGQIIVAGTDTHFTPYPLPPINTKAYKTQTNRQ